MTSVISECINSDADYIVCGPLLVIDHTILLSEYIEKKTESYGNKVVQIDSETGASLTYEQFRVKSDQLCLALQSEQLGLLPNESVAIIARNSIEYVWVLFGAMKAKVCSVLLNPEYTPREINHNFIISKPKLVICSYAVAVTSCDHVLGCTMAEMFAATEGVQEVWVWGAPPDVNLSNMKCKSLDALLAKAECEQVFTQKNGTEVVPTDLNTFILSSSGSTGLPKSVLVSNTSVIAALETSSNYASTDEIALGLMPFFHAYGLILMLMCLCEGTCIVVMKKFTVNHFIKTIEDHQVNNLYLVPSLLAILSKHEEVKKAQLRSVRHIWTGAAPVSNKLQEITRKKFEGQAVLHHSYGLTETTFTTFAGDCRPDKRGSPGKPTPGFQCKVIDIESGLPQGPNIKGELCFRGPLLMRGYKGNKQATDETIDEDQWLHSGDLGYYDDDGYFYIVDRLKELIKYQGHQVSPSELEAILVMHNAIQDAAVIGIPHEVFGELTQALIVKQPNVDISEKEIQDFLSDEVSPHKRLHGGVRFIDKIPKTPSGKILRRELKELYLQH